MLIPAKHRVDRFRKLYVIRLVDAARINPEILEFILCSLLPAEGKLATTFLFYAFTDTQVVVGDFLVAWTPGVQENSIGWNAAA
jgi:hypothetical protein